MINIAKCPYRISLLGGSSDLDWFVSRNKRGLTLGFSLQSYSTIVLKFRNDNQIGILNYSSREEYEDVENITHPIIREALEYFNIKKPLELASFGDSIGGSGLGSSSSFSVALVKGLSDLNKMKLSNFEIAHIASEIEIKKLNKSIGRQDQYLCALGGVNILDFKCNGVELIKKNDLNELISDFSKELFLVNTGISRSATQPLDLIRKDINSYDSIKRILEIADRFINISDFSDKKRSTDLLCNAIIESWKIKRIMPGVMNENLFNLEKKLLNNNFHVLKLLGAGGGGYFLVKFKDENLDEAIIRLKNLGEDFRKVTLDKEGLKSWEI